MPLFPDPSRERSRWLGRAEPAVHWYTECTLPESVAGRRALNAWYAKFPDPKGALRERLRSETDAVHHQSMDELYLHHLLTASVEKVGYEEGGTGPDFRLYEGGLLVGAVEVASLFMRQDWQDESRSHGSLADQVNSRLKPTAGWFVGLDIVRSERQPSVTKLVSFVEAELGRLPPPGPEARALVGDRVGEDRLPSAVYRAEGVEILLEFLPMRPDAASISDPDAGIIGMGPVIGGMINSGARLRSCVAHKGGGRYEIDGAPFLVVVGIHDSFCTQDQIEEGLYGGEAIDIETRRSFRRRDGLFGDGTHHTRVSAVGTLPKLVPWESPPGRLTVWDHPAPLTPWPDRLLRFDRRLSFPTDGGPAYWRTT